MVSRRRHGREVIGGSLAMETEDVCTSTVFQSQLFPGSRAAHRCVGRGAPLDVVAFCSVMSQATGPAGETTREQKRMFRHQPSRDHCRVRELVVGFQIGVPS